MEPATPMLIPSGYPQAGSASHDVISRAQRQARRHGPSLTNTGQQRMSRDSADRRSHVTRGAVRSYETRQTDRQTVLIWDTNPHTPRLYFKPAPPLRLPRHNDLLGLHLLIAGMEMYYASPAEPRRPVAPLVFGLSCSVGTLGVRMCITERLEVDVDEEPPVGRRSGRREVAP